MNVNLDFGAKKKHHGTPTRTEKETEEGAPRELSDLELVTELILKDCVLLLTTVHFED